MSARILLLAQEHPRRRQLEDLLADQRTSMRPFPVRGAAWEGRPPDLLVVLALQRTPEAVETVRAALMAEPDLSVLVVDEESRWPEALRLLPGVAVMDLSSRAAFLAARDRLLERRALLASLAAGREQPSDELARAALQGEVSAVREMALLLERLAERRAHIVLAGEPGTARRRILKQLAREGGDDVLLLGELDALSPVEQSDVLVRARAGRRVLASATPDFGARVKDASFRTDLYYLLGGKPVFAPPLRERKADLPLLARACGLADPAADVLAMLAGYGWPGNLRELELVVSHALLLAGGRPVQARDVVLPESGRGFLLRIPAEGVVPLEEVERELLRQTLEAADRNVTEAARRLAVGREKLRYRLRRHGLGR